MLPSPLQMVLLHGTQQMKHRLLTSMFIIIISGFGIYGAAVVPDSGVGNTWQRITLVLHEFLSNGLTPSRLHIVISFLTHADHVFLGLPRFLVPGTPNRVMELMQEVARCTCPYHLRRRVRCLTYLCEVPLSTVRLLGDVLLGNIEGRALITPPKLVELCDRLLCFLLFSNLFCLCIR